MHTRLLCTIFLTSFLSIITLLHAQNDIQLESNLIATGNITLGQDDTQTPVRGMMRFDTMTHTFQGYDGVVWIDLGASEVEVNNRTDTLEIGDSFGGGIVFHTVGINGLVVMEFDLALPSNLLETTIPWGDTQVLTGATSRTNGEQNTADIITSNQNWSSGEYAAKICDDLTLGGYTDWYLPAIEEFILINNNVGTGASGANNNIANLDALVYWSSTESDMDEAIYYHVGQQDDRILTKDITFSVRAIRAY